MVDHNLGSALSVEAVITSGQQHDIRQLPQE